MAALLSRGAVTTSAASRAASTSKTAAAARPARALAVTPRAVLATRSIRRAPQQEQAAVATPARKPAGFEIGFTRDNEVFVGRMAMMGFAASVVGEALSGGQGALAQLGYTLGLPQAQVGLFLAGLVSFNLAASLLPSSPTFRAARSGGAAAGREEEGPLSDPNITIFNVKKFFGVTDWGFTPQNELFAGRMAQLGFVASLLGELATGLGPLGQLSAETGVPAGDLRFALAAWAVFMACTAVDKVAVRTQQRGKTGAGRAGGSGKQSAKQPQQQGV